MLKQISIVLVCLIAISVNAQFEFGLKGGLNSIDLISDGIRVDDGVNNLKLDFKGSSYGHHFGLYSRVSFLGIFIEPQVMFNSNKVNYTLTEFSENGPIQTVKSEKYNNLDIPVLVGIKAGIIRFYAGPVGHVYISSASDLVNIKGYSQKFKEMTYGYQAGFGFDIWKMRLDLTYENNFSNFGDHINIGGNDYSFNDGAARILGTAGFRF